MGPIGPQGPSGLIGRVVRTLNSSAFSNVAPGDFISHSGLICQNGEVLLGGGCGSNVNVIALIESQPSTANSRTWECKFRNEGTLTFNGVVLTAYAVCGILG